ncbi:hypothetical protein ACQ4PT_014513 [Festuca glaucescens]
MSHRNISWTHQVANLESERGLVQAQPDNLTNGGTGSNLSNPGVQVAFGIPGNTTNVGVCDLRSYYESNNNQHQHGQNLYPHVGIDPSSVYPSTMYNPSIPTPSANRYVPHTQSFGLGNPLPSPSYHQVATGTLDESSSSSNFGDTTREFIKRKNAVLESGHHFVHGFASSSSSAHAPQNPAHGPWSASFESHGAPNAASADAPNRNSMATHPSLVHYGNYVFPAGHMGQSNTWNTQPANGIADGVPHWEYNNAVRNPPGHFVHSGTIGMPNGSLQDYQAGHSAICHGPLPHFGPIPVHSMQAPAMLNHIQMPGPQRHSNTVHGVNASGIGLTLDPRLAFLYNSGHTTGPQIHGFLSNQVNNGSLRMMPYENAALMDLSRFYEADHLIDEHLDMGLDIDSMTYEELVALEEQIGYVSTGLTESYIKENLRLNLYVPGAACMSDQSPLENDACIICQEEYEAREVVGTLDCRHKYHAVCIKQWLMVKNLCPICKTTALSADRSSG